MSDLTFVNEQDEKGSVGADRRQRLKNQMDKTGDLFTELVLKEGKAGIGGIQRGERKHLEELDASLLERMEKSAANFSVIRNIFSEDQIVGLEGLEKV